MKIVRIIARLNVGGPARHVIWLTEAMRDGEFETVLVAGTVPEGEEDMGYFAADHGVEPVFIPEMSREMSPNDAVSLFKVLRLISREKPDVIHTHTAKAGTVGRLAALLYRWLFWKDVKVVHTFHGHVFHSYYGRLKSSVFLAIERALARLATDRIVVISDQQRDEINRVFGVGRTEQFVVIPLGIDLGSYDPAPGARESFRESIGAGSDELVVGFVGRLTGIKNLPMLIETAGQYRATIAGAGTP
ncbi:MAG TPA: glycosyltransferase [Pyrinomonadaceae bacterium]|nr:glycosyltransferase [Pyrinomonadaceae bacterium]